MSFILVLSYTKYIPHISYSCVTSVRLMVQHSSDYYYYSLLPSDLDFQPENGHNRKPELQIFQAL